MKIEVKPGSICWGTHREEYLWDALRPYLPSGEEWVAEGDKLSAALHSPYSLPIEEEIEIRQYLAEIINNEAWEWMNRIAPKGHYFGTNPGDGSDFGFWEIDDIEDFEDEEELPSHHWGYPIYYIHNHDVLCPDCANGRGVSREEVLEFFNWEDPHLYCDECGERVESAYAEDEAEELEMV